MHSSEVKRIREKLGLNQTEFAQIFGLSSAVAVSNIETGFRKPSKTKILMLSLLDSLPKNEAQNLLKKLAEEARRYEES